MKTYAYVQHDASVYTLIQGPDGFSPSDCYRGSLPSGEWVSAPDDILPGDSYIDGEWVYAPRPAVPLTQLQFLRRFTAQERIAIRSSTDPVIIDFLHLLDLAQEVLTDDPDTVAAIGYLEQQGYIDAGRGEEILA